MRLARLWFLVLAGVGIPMISGCGGAREAQENSPARQNTTLKAPQPEPANESYPPVTLQQDIAPLNETLRVIGERYRGGFALVHGTGLRMLPPLDWKKKPYHEAITEIATAGDCFVQKTEDYYFIHPAGYESLLQLSLESQLAALGGPSFSCAFGEGTRLFRVCSVLGKSTGRAIIADNVLAETYCGELALGVVPWWVALEAALRTARIVPEMLHVDASADYVFLGTSSSNNTTFLLNPDAVSEQWRQRLDSKVSLQLELEGPRKLGPLLPTLGQHLGIQVDADGALREIPINPFFMPNVTVQTALDLMVRQWPLPYFGYRIEGDTIRFVDARKP